MAQKKIQNQWKLIREFVNQLMEIYPIDSVILYGSYARGWQDQWSDIDLAVVSKSFDRYRPQEWRKVRRLAMAVSPLLDPRIFGLKEFHNFERGDFVHEIRRTGKSIFTKGRFRFPTTH